MPAVIPHELSGQYTPARHNTAEILAKEAHLPLAVAKLQRERTLAGQVLISHDMDEALAHRVIVLAGAPGKIAGDFTPDLPQPVNRSSVVFFEWKKQLTDLLSGPNMTGSGC